MHIKNPEIKKEQKTKKRKGLERVNKMIRDKKREKRGKEQGYNT